MAAVQGGKRWSGRAVGLAMAAAVVVVALGGTGVWFAFVRVSDPAKRAEALSAQGDLRGALIEMRSAVRARPDAGALRLQMGQLLLQVFEPLAAEKELRTARSLGVGQWVVAPLLGEALAAQARWTDVLNDVPRGGPTTLVVARDLLWRSMAQIAQKDLFAAQTSLTLAREGAPDRIEVPLIAALVARAQGDKAAAETALDEVLRRDPALLDALLLKREMLSERGDATDAMAMADRAVAAARWSPAARLGRASLLLAAGEDAKARLDVSAVLARFPRYPAANYLDGVLLSRAGRFAAAGVALDQLRPWIDQFPRAVYLQAVVAAGQGKFGPAVELAARYHLSAPGDAAGVVLLAQTQMAADRADEAVVLLEGAMTAGLRSAAAMDLLGAGYEAQGNADLAVRTLRQASAAARGDAGIATDLALAQIGQWDTKGAIDTLTTARETSAGSGMPVPSIVEAGLVLANLDLGELDRAAAVLERLRIQAGDSEATGVLSGQILLARADLAGAQAASLAALKKYPESAGAKVTLAKALTLQGRQGEGEKLLQDLLGREPARFEAVTAYLQFLLQNDRYKGAVEVLEKARAASPDPLLLAMEGDLLVRSGEPKRAAALLSRAPGGEGSPVLLAALGRAQAAAGMGEEAKATYRRLIQVAPRFLEGRRAQAALLLQLREVDAAKATLRDALAAMPGAWPVMSTLVALEGQTGGLAASLQMAADIRADPANMPGTAVLKGDALMASRRVDAAMTAYRAEHDATPSSLLVQRLAAASMAAGQIDAGAQALRGWLAGHDEDVDAARMLAWLEVAAKHYDQAASWYERVLARRPGDVVAMNNLAWTYEAKGDPRARELAQRAYLRSPSPQTADTLGWIMVQQGETKAAAGLLQRVRLPDGQPASPTTGYHLAVALEKDGKGADAASVLRPILSGGAAFPDRAAAVELLDRLSGR